ncbi:phosphonopyruvate decarboxylase [Natronospira bacteriovora]|uniref:Phosphonopyruvate decarboxylase n=1 Tax=Natronospira bacteriovora TaxID=3069753 RepID=A0ABU0W7G1_9GAMM|nr:phosphonopyruvate decarboxylase [Natronospira sp. AB-CW4]MDQ2069902.1 phosphonopyruvate decarboxylase [Natronospira sp. AB-CW4]
MHQPKAVYASIRDQGIRFFTGVPDSLLKDFCAYVTDHAADEDHVITANEGNAVSLAAGHFLGTGEPALVYMQNSGIGNAVNPLLSLADPEVYGVPMLLMIGWRGEPGVKDEPQHVKQGRVMTELMDAMEIPWYELSSETTDSEAVVAEACRQMREKSMPVALLVRKGAFDKYKLQKDVVTDYPMNREGAVKCVIDLLSADDVVISTTGKTSRELYEYRAERGDGHGSDFLTVGAMGHTASIAMGVARAQPERKVICLDGDGSVLMHMGALAVIGQSSMANFMHVVINNGAHDSVGGQPTVGFQMKLPEIASACGYQAVASVHEADDVKAEMARLRQHKGPVLLEIKTNKGARDDLGRPRTTPIENRDAFMRRLGLTPER